MEKLLSKKNRGKIREPDDEDINIMLKKLQNLGDLNELLSILLRLDEMVKRAKKQRLRNLLFLPYSYHLLIEEIEQEINKAPYIVKISLRKMLFYSPYKINFSLKLFRRVEKSLAVFVVALIATVWLEMIFSFGEKFVLWFIFLYIIGLVFVLSAIVYIWYYFSIDVKFVSSFERLLKQINRNSEEATEYFFQGIKEAREFMKKQAKIDSDTKLNQAKIIAENRDDGCNSDISNNPEEFSVG